VSLLATLPDAERTLRRDLLVLTLLAALLYFPGLGRRDLWNPDEARYAQVAREMRQTGSWALPHLNGQLYTQKPPLLFWSIAGFGILGGEIDETAARLPSVLAAVGSSPRGTRSRSSTRPCRSARLRAIPIRNPAICC
jgi:4-amino-4-deoxy-L-arabinose transferase-like glycosyltransferase